MRYLFIITLLLSGCMFSGKTNLTVNIPQIPPGWENISGSIDIELSFYSEGRRETVSGCRFGDEIKLEIEKGLIPITAYPSLESVILKPAGAVYPENLIGDSLDLTWAGGFGAEILLNLSEKGCDFSNFNIRRFNMYINDISQGNPWKISEPEILYALSNNIFNSNYVALREFFLIELSDPFFEGRWKFANPLENSIYTDSGGGHLIIDNIFTGHHVLLNMDSAELKSGELFIENERWRVIFNNGDVGGGLSGDL
jgi:hypothetical protein